MQSNLPVPRRILSLIAIAALALISSPAQAIYVGGGGGGGGGYTPPPTLSIVTKVTNDDAGTKGPADFTAGVISGSSTVPQQVTGAGAMGASVILNPGPYTVTPGADPGYTMTASAGCSGTLTDGQTAVCTITYDDVRPEPTPPATPPDSGTTTPPVEPTPPPTPPAAPPPHAPPASPGSVAASATDTGGSEASATEPAPVQEFASATGAGCVWFWGWLGCYWWILLLIIIAILLWKARRAWQKHQRDRQAQRASAAAPEPPKEPKP